MTVATRNLDQVLAHMARGDLAATFTFVRVWGHPVAMCLVGRPTRGGGEAPAR